LAGRPDSEITREDLRAVVLAGLSEAPLAGTENFLGFGGATLPRAQVTNQKINLEDILAAEVAKIREAFRQAGIRNPNTRDIFDAYQEARARGLTP
jgi:hypothetical protein